jgi:hypothetical protein
MKKYKHVKTGAIAEGEPASGKSFKVILEDSSLSFIDEAFLLSGNDWIPIATPLFTTEDGVDIYEGDTYFGCGKWPDGSPSGCIKDSVATDTRLDRKYGWNKTFKCFSTKEAAEEYVLMNKPVLSLNDLLSHEDLLKGRGVMQIFKNLAKTKITK